MNMKRFFSIVMAVGIVSAFWGCDSFAKLSDSGKTSQGAPYELVVVSNNQVWDGIVGDTLRSILRQPCRRSTSMSRCSMSCASRPMVSRMSSPAIATY